MRNLFYKLDESIDKNDYYFIEETTFYGMNKNNWTNNIIRLVKRL